MTTRFAIFSDMHGNSAATEAILAAIDVETPDAVYCLGDLVGYGARPNETVALIRERGIPTIMGNYDDGVGFDRDDCGCAYKDKDEEARGQQSLMWTRGVTTPENKAYLRTLLPEIRFEAEGKRFRLVHGSPRRMNEYLFEDRDPRSLERIAAQRRCRRARLRPHPQTVGARDWRASSSSMTAAWANRRTAIPAPPGRCSPSIRTPRSRSRSAA